MHDTEREGHRSRKQWQCIAKHKVLRILLLLTKNEREKINILHFTQLLDPRGTASGSVAIAMASLFTSTGYVVFLLQLTAYRLASYPGLLTPAFAACNTNAGEGLVKLSHVQ